MPSPVFPAARAVVAVLPPVAAQVSPTTEAQVIISFISIVEQNLPTGRQVTERFVAGENIIAFNCMQFVLASRLFAFYSRMCVFGFRMFAFRRKQFVLR